MKRRDTESVKEIISGCDTEMIPASVARCYMYVLRHSYLLDQFVGVWFVFVWYVSVPKHILLNGK